MVELSQAMVDGVLADHPDVLCDAGVSQSVVKVRILNSNGLDASYEKTVFSLGLGGTLVRGTDMLFVGDGESSCSPITDASEIVARVTGQLDQAQDMAEVTTGSFPVVFTPDAVAGLLLSPLLVGFNGKTVLQGSSPSWEGSVRRSSMSVSPYTTMAPSHTAPGAAPGTMRGYQPG